MTRSKWKNPHVDSTLISKIKTHKKMEIKTMARNSEILPSFIDKSFSIHTGNSYKNITISEEMVGHKLGEFAFTRKPNVFKKKTNKK